VTRGDLSSTVPAGACGRCVHEAAEILFGAFGGTAFMPALRLAHNDVFVMPAAGCCRRRARSAGAAVVVSQALTAKSA
jgi:hypothetical protein